MGKPIRGGVYAIRNASTGEMYIGSTNHLDWRWITHRSRLNRLRHSNRALQQAWNRDGPAAFSMIVLRPVACDGALIAAEREEEARARAVGTVLYNDQVARGRRPRKAAA